MSRSIYTYKGEPACYYSSVKFNTKEHIEVQRVSVGAGHEWIRTGGCRANEECVLLNLTDGGILTNDVGHFHSSDHLDLLLAELRSNVVPVCEEVTISAEQLLKLMPTFEQKLDRFKLLIFCLSRQKCVFHLLQKGN